MNRSPILEKFSGLVALAFLVSLCLFVLSNNISDFMINEMSREKPDEKIVRQLEEYIGDNLLTSESREQLRRWCKVNQIDIEVFVDGALRYRSAFVPHNDEDTIPESEEDRERAYQIRFADAVADVVFFQYLRTRVRVTGTELILSTLLFFFFIF